MLDDMTNLQSLLKDPSLLATQGYLAGEWVDGEGGATFPVRNPARGDVVAKLDSLMSSRLESSVFKIRSCAPQAQKKKLYMVRSTFLHTPGAQTFDFEGLYAPGSLS